MKTVIVMANNLKPRDIYEGRKICGIHKYQRRVRVKSRNVDKLESIGVLVITPSPSGNNLETFKFVEFFFTTSVAKWTILSPLR